MHPALSGLFLLLFVLLCLLGILANGFIVLALSREWRRRGRVLPSDLILLCLGASRFCLQWVGMVHNLYFCVHLAEYSRAFVRQLFRLHWHFLNSATFWFGTWLSALFCVKITAFTHPTFLWLKWRFPGSVPWLLLGSLLLSSVVTLLIFWGNHLMYQAFLTQKFSGNVTYEMWSRRLQMHYILPLKFVTMSIPCSVFLVSAALLIDSLRRHRRAMRHLQDPSTQAHTRALKSLVSFLVLYVLSFASLMIDATTDFFSLESDWYWPWQILIYLCMSVHPFILILSNPRLQGVFRQLLLSGLGGMFFLGRLCPPAPPLPCPPPL